MALYHGGLSAASHSLVSSATADSCCAVQGLPYSGSAGTVFVYGLILATMGLTISWAAPACNNPVFAEVQPSPAPSRVQHPALLCGNQREAQHLT